METQSLKTLASLEDELSAEISSTTKKIDYLMSNRSLLAKKLTFKGLKQEARDSINNKISQFNNDIKLEKTKLSDLEFQQSVAMNSIKVMKLRDAKRALRINEKLALRARQAAEKKAAEVAKQESNVVSARKKAIKKIKAEMTTEEIQEKIDECSKKIQSLSSVLSELKEALKDT